MVPFPFIPGKLVSEWFSLFLDYPDFRVSVWPATSLFLMTLSVQFLFVKLDSSKNSGNIFQAQYLSELKA